MREGPRMTGLELEEKSYCQCKNNLDQREVFIGLHRVPECQRMPQVEIHLERNDTFVLFLK